MNLNTRAEKKEDNSKKLHKKNEETSQKTSFRESLRLLNLVAQV